VYWPVGLNVDWSEIMMALCPYKSLLAEHLGSSAKHLTSACSAGDAHYFHPPCVIDLSSLLPYHYTLALYLVITPSSECHGSVLEAKNGLADNMALQLPCPAILQSLVVWVAPLPKATPSSRSVTGSQFPTADQVLLLQRCHWCVQSEVPKCFNRW
jgi:hypothetical protein